MSASGAGVLSHLGMIGNSQISALVSADGNIPWCCWPMPDGDPIFCGLLTKAAVDATRGVFAIELVGQCESSLAYRRNTAILCSEARDERGNAIRITTFCPRFLRHGRLYRPAMLIRRVEPVSGRPCVRIRLRPAAGYGDRALEVRRGSHHLRFYDGVQSLRMTTDEGLAYIAEERVFVLDRARDLVLSCDEALPAAASELAEQYLGATNSYWQEWVRSLALPSQWQEATIRAAITLQLNRHEDTGAVLAAPTTSIPEAPATSHTWDYRYCWLRDMPSTVRAFDSLGAISAMESLLHYLEGIVVREGESLLKPVYGPSGEPIAEERTIESLDGFLGMGPVRLGSHAGRQRQHDLYGSLILALTPAFFDARLTHPGDEALFQRLERLGERAVALFEQPDAGIWESRTTYHANTFPAAMCWAACSRLARIATQLHATERQRFWQRRADGLREQILRRCWSESKGVLSARLDSAHIDASLLLLPKLGLLGWTDTRFQRTLAVIERELDAGGLLVHARGAHDQNAFLACSFWRCDALAACGRTEEARQRFEQLLDLRNAVGLLSEHADPQTGSLWGNFPRTSSMVGILRTARRVSTAAQLASDHRCAGLSKPLARVLRNE